MHLQQTSGVALSYLRFSLLVGGVIFYTPGPEQASLDPYRILLMARYKSWSLNATPGGMATSLTTTARNLSPKSSCVTQSKWSTFFLLGATYSLTAFISQEIIKELVSLVPS